MEGFNEIPSAKKRSILLIVVDVVREPMFLLLVGAGLVYLVLGNLEEALMLLSFVVVVMGITIYQERKTERALEALQDLSSPRALVIRGGQQKRIAGREVVREDILVLSEGDRVPADGALLSCLNLSVDESLLTGESAPVRKTAAEGSPEMGRAGGEGLPFVFSGTMVVKGQGIAKVLATGVRTEMGKIGRALERVQVEETSLQKETRGWVGLLASVGLVLCTVVVVVYGLTRGNWLEGFLAGIATAMSLLPEELPVILTVFLAVGAWRISQKRVLTRRAPAVETLGAATVLCVDKTGTITLNRMTVGKIFDGAEFFAVGRPEGGRLPDAFHELVEFSILASQRDPFDPMEKAIHQLGESTLARTEHLHGDWSLVREYPLSERLLALSHVWKSPDDEEYVIAAKGAPEAISNLCHFGHGADQELSKHISALADDGMRVLGVARAKFQRGSLPGEQHDFKFEFLGLVGLVDPVRPGVAEAVQECYAAGIRVVVITGDYPGTAQYVARQIGLAQAQDFITGPGLDEMDDLELQQRIRTVNIFAR
ncbi:MAG: HAD-IC family P-type ATPase, partial [Dehalococcoidia bacterium]|nr:HAD-IC family P-type ATPase [Dehalococcoidia bacterium]